MTSRHSKVLIIGSGPAGYTAGVYAARAALEPVLIEGMQPGGQLTITTDVENWPGDTSVLGPALMTRMREQVEHLGTTIVADLIVAVDLSQRPFLATGDSGVRYTSDTLVIATGASARWLGLASETRYRGAGVSACATCDGFFYRGRTVAVVGGGNTAVEEALYLTNFAEKVFLIHRRDTLRADRTNQQRLFANPKIEMVWNAEVVEVTGDGQVVTGVSVCDPRDGTQRSLTTDGLFVAIGHDPATELFRGQLDMDEDGYILVTPGSTATSVAGVFAAGDVQDKVFRQAVTSAGMGCMAALEAERFLAGHNTHAIAAEGADDIPPRTRTCRSCDPADGVRSSGMMMETTMSTTNPLLDHAGLPRFSEVTPAHVGPAVDAVIADHAAAMAVCREGGDFATVFLAKERADAAMARMWQVVSHLAMVANTPDLRAAHQAAQATLSAYEASVGQDRVLYDALDAIPREGLSAAERRALDLTIRGFELSGVALEPEHRARFADISVRSSRLSTEFANAVMDATEAWTLHVTDATLLAGVGEADRAMLAAQAEAKGLDGWLVDLHAASLRTVLNYADDRALRRTVYEALVTRASDVGPHAGRFDNSARIDELLALRHDAAELLGFDTPVARSLATKMARDADDVQDFLLDLARRARPRARVELDGLSTFAADRLGIAQLEPWDIGYASEKLRLEHHAIDEAAIKRHLPLPRVLEGLFGLVDDLFGIQIRAAANVDVWHPDAAFFTLHRGGDTPFAGIYCDFFARSGKNGGAWMDVCRPRLLDADAPTMPIAFLNCNFGRPLSNEPAYISHGEMVTLFHEMGHCLHHVLTEVNMPSVGGIAGVEWDAVELPSQFMENFAWEPAMLRAVSAHAETGVPLADDVIGRMLDARRFLGAMALVRQVELSLFDIRLHLAAADPDRPSALAILSAVRNEVAVVQPPEWNRLPHSFGHIFGGSYAAGYYSYLWAERLSADAFEPFAGAGADRLALGGAFREHVLARGGTRTATDNFVAFRGREPQTDALLRSWGLAA